MQAESPSLEKIAEIAQRLEDVEALLDRVEDPVSNLTVDGLECLICTEIMEDPVITADGCSYCRRCILDWFRTCDAKAKRRHCGPEMDSFETNPLAPATLLPLLSREVIPNTALRQAIESYIDAKMMFAQREQQHRLFQKQFASVHATIRELRAQVGCAREIAQTGVSEPVAAKPLKSLTTELAVEPAHSNIGAKKKTAGLKRIGNDDDVVLAAAPTGMLSAQLLSSKPVTRKEEGIENGEAERFGRDPLVAKLVVQLAGSTKKKKKKKAKRTRDDDDDDDDEAILAAAIQQAKVEKDMLQEMEKKAEEQREKEAITNAQEEHYKNIYCPTSDTSKHEIFSSSLKETGETLDGEIEVEKKNRNPVEKCTRLSSAVHQFTAGHYDNTRLVQCWSAADANQVEKDTVLRQIIRQGFEEDTEGLLLSRIVIVLVTVLKNEPTSWPMIEYELTAGFCRSKAKAHALGNFFRVPEFYTDFLSELLTIDLHHVTHLKGMLEPLIGLEDREMGHEALTSVLLRVQASRGIPGLKVAVQRMELARIELARN
jgi:hypothetical protein